MPNFSCSSHQRDEGVVKKVTVFWRLIVSKERVANAKSRECKILTLDFRRKARVSFCLGEMGV